MLFNPIWKSIWAVKDIIAAHGKTESGKALKFSVT